MRRMATVVVTVVTASLWAMSAQAQSLADVARREAERRKGIKAESARVFTNADLRPTPGSAGVTPKQDQPPPTAADAPGSEEAEAGILAAPDSPTAAESDSTTAAEPQVPVKAREKRDEQYWRGRIADYQQRLARMQGDIATMRGRLSTIDAKLDTARSDEDRLRLQRDRAGATSVLAGFRRNLGFLQSEYDGVKELAASRNVDPDWVR